jgi:hypothetical protein
MLNEWRDKEGESEKKVVDAVHKVHVCAQFFHSNASPHMCMYFAACAHSVVF